MIERSRFSKGGQFLGGSLSMGFALAVFCLPGASPQTRTTLQKGLPSVLSYEKDILPFFRARCLGCHGEKHPQAGFDARTLGRILEGGHSGAAVTSGSVEKSLLYQVVASKRMPPSPAVSLSASEIARIALWIKTGAKGKTADAGHWAFRPVVRPTIPKLTGTAAAPMNPVDRFLLTEL